MAKTRSMSRNQNRDDDDNDASSSRWKRINTFDNASVPPWSHLNHHVLFLVMMELGIVDFLAFSGVCKSWRSLASSNRNMFMASRPPMKIRNNPHENNKDSYCFLEDFEGRRFKTILPHFAGRTCIGLTCGYLIFYGEENRNFCLLNPITRHELNFPDYPFFLSPNEKVMRAILVFSPSRSRLVFIILHRMLNVISFSIASERGWNHVPCTLPILSTSPIIDLLAFKGKIYTILSDCSLGEFRLGSNGEHTWKLLKTKNIPKPVLLDPELVSLGEKLYVISCLSRPNTVLELDFVEMKWVMPEKIIREYAIFHSILKSSAAVKRTQCKNYVYFLDTDESQQRMIFCSRMWYFPHDSLNVNHLDE